MAVKRGVRLFISIVERGQGKALGRFYDALGLTCHFQTVGRGTASSDLLDILGIGSLERDVLLSFGERERVQRMMYLLSEDEGDVPARGIVFSIPLTALNTLAAAVLMREGNDTGEQDNGRELGKEESGMQGSREDVHSLILIVVNQGHTDEVMNTARRAGARGGTIIRSRWAGAEEAETFYGITLQAEKEIIAIVAGGERRRLIMETVNKAHGMNTPAGALVCSVGIEEMEKVG